MLTYSPWCLKTANAKCWHSKLAQSRLKKTLSSYISLFLPLLSPLSLSLTSYPSFPIYQGWLLFERSIFESQTVALANEQGVTEDHGAWKTNRALSISFSLFVSPFFTASLLCSIQPRANSHTYHTTGHTHTHAHTHIHIHYIPHSVHVVGPSTKF